MNEKEASRLINTMNVSDIIDALVAELGARLTTYIGGGTDTIQLDEWKRNDDHDRHARLATALHATRIIGAATGREAARAWFTGTNRELRGESPAHVLEKAAAGSRDAVVAAAYAEVAR